MAMSATDVISVISAIIGIVDGAIKVYHAAADASGAPESLRDAANRLPLIKETLATAANGLGQDEPQELYDAMTACLESCEQKAQKLNLIFQKALSPPNTPFRIKLLRAAKASIKEGKVTKLVDGIRDDLQVLTANHAIRSATRAEMSDLIKAISNPAGAQGGTGRVAAYNLGPGTQNNHMGQGDMYNNSGPGPQIGGTISGPININSAPPPLS